MDSSGGCPRCRCQEKSVLHILAMLVPGKWWKELKTGGGRSSGKCNYRSWSILVQILLLMVVFALMISGLVVLSSFGTLLSWQHRISVYVDDHLMTTNVAEVIYSDGEVSNTTDLHRVEYHDQYSPSNSSGVTTGPVESNISTGSTTGPKLPYRKEPVVHYSAPNGSWYLEQLHAGKECRAAATSEVQLIGLERFQKTQGGTVRLPAGEDHELLLVSSDGEAVPGCNGGDYFETDLNGSRHGLDDLLIFEGRSYFVSCRFFLEIHMLPPDMTWILGTGEHWKSRPPVKDLGNGTYAVKLRVETRFAGNYSFQASLLFGSFSGLYQQPQKHAKFKTVLNVTLQFYVPERSAASAELESTDVETESLPLCREQDLQTYPWQGRWTRTKTNVSCRADADGRWRCLDPEEPCEFPYCEGPVGRLESNGWAYSTEDCHFRIFTQSEAWNCLAGKHIFFWGDSNHPDTTRNLLNFLLGKNFGNFPRIYDRVFDNPQNPEQNVRFSVIFNGHVIMKRNNMGLTVLANEKYTASIRQMLDPESIFGNRIPDALILNSGIHDGIWWKDLTEYISASSTASSFWASVWRNTSRENDDGSKRPKVVYRTTIVPAGASRSMPANPQKMEVLNHIMVDNMVRAFGRENLRIVDAFDMTFPFHYDNFYSDGGHYGRIPNPNSWWPGGHMYFVDVMLAHILLNSICPL
ncbi:hypothetical protein R1sor_026336 [Riccia sorocarpa]|uniref:Uncharacterized protein n=1 Tax=Riccia sorocarpa TaxID=122646 RepID=A0ABD3GBQ9_9MARC